MDAQGPPPDPNPDLITQATRTVREMTASIEVNRSLLTRAKEQLQDLDPASDGYSPTADEPAHPHHLHLLGPLGTAPPSELGLVRPLAPVRKLHRSRAAGVDEGHGRGHAPHTGAHGVIQQLSRPNASCRGGPGDVLAASRRSPH